MSMDPSSHVRGLTPHAACTVTISRKRPRVRTKLRIDVASVRRKSPGLIEITLKHKLPRRFVHTSLQVGGSGPRVGCAWTHLVEWADEPLMCKKIQVHITDLVTGKPRDLPFSLLVYNLAPPIQD